MKVEWPIHRIKNPCCEGFTNAYAYDHITYNIDDRYFHFENEEENPINYCMFCGNRIEATYVVITN